jgi:hypothetical protein
LSRYTKSAEEPIPFDYKHSTSVAGGIKRYTSPDKSGGRDRVIWIKTPHWVGVGYAIYSSGCLCAPEILRYFSALYLKI